MEKVLGVLCLAALAGCSQGPPAPEAPRAQDAATDLKPLVEKLLAAWATLDVKNPAPFYAQDAGLIFYDIAPLKYSGWADYAAGFQKVSAGWKSMKVSLNPDLQATRYGNIAWATYTATFEVEMKQGPGMKGEARTTDLFEKRGNDWIIIHEHVSAPLPDGPPSPPAKK